MPSSINDVISEAVIKVNILSGFQNLNRLTVGARCKYICSKIQFSQYGSTTDPDTLTKVQQICCKVYHDLHRQSWKSNTGSP